MGGKLSLKDRLGYFHGRVVVRVELSWIVLGFIGCIDDMDKAVEALLTYPGLLDWNWDLSRLHGVHS